MRLKVKSSQVSFALSCAYHSFIICSNVSKVSASNNPHPNTCSLLALSRSPPSVNSMVSLRVAVASWLARVSVPPLHPSSRPARHWCRGMGLTDWPISGQGSCTDQHKRGWNFVSVVRGGCSAAKQKLLLLMKLSPEWLLLLPSA